MFVVLKIKIILRKMELQPERAREREREVRETSKMSAIVTYLLQNT